MTSARQPRRMAGFELVLHRLEPPARVWQALWDLDRHTAAISLTRVGSCDGLPLRQGSEFVARTGVGRIGFDDRMEVQAWDPPRQARIAKTGRVLRGSITVELVADGAGTLVRWRQRFAVLGIPDVLARAAAPVVALGYRVSLTRILV